MPAVPQRWRAYVRGILAYLAVAGLATLYFVHRTHADLSGLEPFWDARVYARALHDWHSGTDPYLATAPSHIGVRLPFVSPPVFLYLMGALSQVTPGRFGALLYLSLASLAALAIPALLARIYIRSHWMSAALCLFIAWFGPGKHGSQALLTGNLSNVLYAVLLAAGAPGLRRNHWLPFHVALVFAALMKPTFLPFLILPLFAGERQLAWCVVVATAVLSGNLLQWATLPTYWHEYQRAVYSRVFVQADAGFGLLGQFTALNHHLPLRAKINPSLEASLVLALLFALLLAYRQRMPSKPLAAGLWTPSLVVFAVLSNPRTLDYDQYIAMIPAIYIVVEFCRSMPVTRGRALGIGASFTLFASLLASQPEAALCLLMVSSVLLTALQWLRPTLPVPERL